MAELVQKKAELGVEDGGIRSKNRGRNWIKEQRTQDQWMAELGKRLYRGTRISGWQHYIKEQRYKDYIMAELDQRIEELGLEDGGISSKNGGSRIRGLRNQFKEWRNQD